MNDNDIMPFGKFKGLKMANVPAKYLLYFYNANKCRGALKEYIKYNLEALELEVEVQERSTQRDERAY